MAHLKKISWTYINGILIMKYCQYFPKVHKFVHICLRDWLVGRLGDWKTMLVSVAYLQLFNLKHSLLLSVLIQTTYWSALAILLRLAQGKPS